MTTRKFSDIEKENLLILGNKIKIKRVNLAWSQSKLAKESKIDRSYISMVERGETNITYLKLLQIGDALDDIFV